VTLDTKDNLRHLGKRVTYIDFVEHLHCIMSRRTDGRLLLLTLQCELLTDIKSYFALSTSAMTHEHTASVKVHQYMKHRNLQQSRACAYVVVCEI
jgi:hypothetical protein